MFMYPPGKRKHVWYIAHLFTEKYRLIYCISDVSFKFPKVDVINKLVSHLGSAFHLDCDLDTTVSGCQG